MVGDGWWGVVGDRCRRQQGLHGRWPVLQPDGAVSQRASSLEDVQAQGVRAGPQGKLQAQRGGRGFVAGPRRAEQEGGPLVLGGTGLQAPDLFGARLRQPTQHRPQAVGQQGLFGDPQPLLRGARLQADQSFCRDALLRQAGQVGHERRPHQQDVAAGVHHSLQGGHQELPCRLTRLGLQQLADRARRPAATRQLGVEGGVPAGPATLPAATEQVSGPDGRSQVRGQARARLLGRKLGRPG